MTTDATQLLPAPAWSDPRVHLLDDTWLLTIFASLLAIAFPWLASGFDVHFIAAALGLLALGAIHIAFTVVARPTRMGERNPLLTAMHIAGVVIVGLIWMNAGGLQNPAFLMVFALPVMGSIFLSRWQPYLMSLVAVAVVGAIAIAQTPELRWYAPGLNTAGAWLATLLDPGHTAANTPFPGFYAPPSYFIVLLEGFAILVFACAVAAEYLGAIFERLRATVDIARAEAAQGREFWIGLIENLPLPTLLVDVDTLHVLSASRIAREKIGFDGGAERSLFDVIHFSYPDMIQELIGRMGGVAPLSMVHGPDGLRATEVHVEHVAQRGRRLALVSIYDKTEELTLRAALDVTGQAVLVIDSRGRVLSFNKPARALFPTVDKDVEAAKLLSLANTNARWWDPGIAGRRKMHVEITPRVFQVTVSASALPGEEERLYIVTFLPVARAAAGELTAIVGSTAAGDTLVNTSVRPRTSPP